MVIEIINSKQKGKRFELRLAKLFSCYGYESRRTAQYCGNTGEAADVVGLPYIHVEAKNQETMRLYDWMKQAVNDSGAENGSEILPAVFNTRNYSPILVTMLLSDWMEIYREYEKNRSEENKNDLD